MVLLIAFAFVAGLGTAISPCVLPVLPLALSAGATGGPRRPLGVVTGLVVTFTFAIVGLVYAIDALGLPDDLLRNVAIGGLILFGLALAIPPVAERMEGALSGLAARAGRGPRGGTGEGFWSGVGVGAGLGFVYAPCAGPILAGVITVSASQSFTGGRLATALAYALGSAVALYALMLGGRRLTRRLSSRAPRFQQALGAVMVVTAALMVADLDLRFQNAIAQDLPGFLVDPSSSLQRSGSVKRELAELRGKPSGLPDLAPAPEIRGTQRWFNTPDGRALTLAELRERRRVVLIDFWTYTCINCIRTLPEVTAWDGRYRDAGLTVIGVHTPEFPFEKDPGNVAAAIDRHDIRYPVAQDNDFATWNAFANQYWPAKYLIDARGRVRYVHFGEGEYEETEQAIRSLLAERDDRPLGAATDARAEEADPGTATPETYLGSDRAEGFVNGVLVPGSRDFGSGRPELAPNGFALRPLDDRPGVGPGGRRRAAARPLSRAPRLPRPGLTRPSASDAGPARRQADPRPAGRARRPRRGRARRPPAALPARGPAQGRRARAHARAGARSRGVRIHVRVTSVPTVRERIGGV